MTLFFQMSVLPSVQPFHAIAYPIDPLLALEIRYHQYLPNVVFNSNGLKNFIHNNYYYYFVFPLPAVNMQRTAP
jgi:hypothetical protein